MSEQGQPQPDAERRAQALAEMGLDDPYENWERENPYDYMPYLVTLRDQLKKLKLLSE